MKRPKRWILAIALLAALVVVAALSFGGGKPIRVKVTRAAEGRVEEIVTANSVGTVEPEKTAVVAAEISGKILKIHIRQGDAPAGRPVVELDDRDLKAEREVTLHDIETSRKRQEQAEVRKKKVWQDLERLRGGTDVFSKRDVEGMERDLEIAKKDEEIAQSALLTLQAQLQILDLKLQKSVIAAPFDGIVVRLHSEEGESVTPGRSLFTLHSSGPLLIRAPVDEVDMGRLRLGLPARVTFDAYYGREFEGLIHEIMPAASTDLKNNRTVDVKIRVPEMPANIYAGMSANIEIIVAAREKVPYLPTHLIHDDREGRGKFVFVAEGKVARRRFVKTGFSNWETTEIAEGLKGDEDVIVPLQFDDEATVTEGARISVVDHGR